MVKNNLNCFVYVLFISLLCCECKRGHGTGSRRGGHTTPRSHPLTTHGYQRPTEGNIGFEQYQPTQSNRQGIGFENVQNRMPPNNPPQYQTHYNPVSNSNPSAPLPPAQQPPGPGIGFENVHQRVSPPQQTNHPYNPYNQQQPQYPGTNYNPSGPYNSYQPPQSYYHPQYSTPGGFPPPIYQPAQQSSGIGGSLLGYAGTFAGGYLIGRLTSGGGDSGQYAVHHYHHDANSVPKEMALSTNSLMKCNQNATQNLCVPNTFPICLANGTIMCVTHSTFTTSCGGTGNLSCVITVLPCTNNDTSCNATAGNFTTTAVYIPCISRITVTQQNVVTSDGINSNQNVQYCVTAIAEPKKLESPVASYVTFLRELAERAYQMSIGNYSAPLVLTSTDPINKTQTATLLPAVSSDNKTEVTTLPNQM